MSQMPTGVWVTSALAMLMLGITFPGDPCSAQSEFSVELSRDLVLGESTGAALGGGLRLAVDSGGKIYVGDHMNRHVVVFSAEGTLEGTLGRTGQGPGEFVSITQVEVARGDSV